jgi:Microfibril-associated/Pre-mRNA processing
VCSLYQYRNMTEDERRKEDAALGKLKGKEKPKWKFMQKYYHQVQRSVYYSVVQSNVY